MVISKIFVLKLLTEHILKFSIRQLTSRYNVIGCTTWCFVGGTEARALLWWSIKPWVGWWSIESWCLTCNKTTSLIIRSLKDLEISFNC